ncbi:Ribosomal RNA processing Brix domain protein isoform 1 [Hibiscus syriacus]|uniref:WAT1-related protein n=1 Tax=Hibiscus syriacus TaxID=106335 RepID=A0A6A2ZZ88_HIBSY|nr:WAT1-related protein At3g30340-like [Hibiscus syriacus]KAE8696876.1 Ribosomal RNA processing Brix domain protein isoform 1 [Hibiscus syriacus]
MKWCGQWSFVVAMVAINFALATTNALYKMILDRGTSRIIILVYRQAISTLCLTPIACVRERKGRPKLTASVFCQLFLNALIGTTLAQYFFLLGLEYTSATFSCAFLNTVPAITLVLALPFGLERVNIRSTAGQAKVVGTLVCIGGAMVLTLYKGKTLAGLDSRDTNNHIVNYDGTMVSTRKRERWGIGSMFPVACAICWSSWFLLQAMIGKRYPSKYSSTAFLSLFSAFQSAILGLVTERDFDKWILKDKLELITVAFAGIVASGLCYVGMSWCVEHRGPVFTSAFTPLVQIFVATFDFSFLHGKLYLGSIIGSILIIIGLYILLWGRNSEAQEMQQPQFKEEGDNNTRSQV